MPTIKHLILALFISLSVSTLAAAQIADAPAQDPEPLIEVQSTTAEDSKIESRIENIYTKIEGISGVKVTVEAGVVSLSGDVANEALAGEARDIAIRTAGVVTVEDNINRTLDVRGNVTPVLKGFQESINKFTRALPLILLALLVFLVFVFLGGRLARFNKFWRKIAPNPFVAELLSQASRFIVIGAGAIIALNLLGASKFVTTLLGGAGVVGIAVGFAVRDSMENYISSIMLSLRQPFRANDHVVINDREGIVVRLTSRATILMTLDGNHLRIPNSVVFKGIILNYTTNPERRFDFELGVDAEDNPIAAMQAGLEAIKTHDFVLDDPKPGASIKTVGDSNIVIKFTGWVNQSDTNFSKARSLAIQSAMKVLDEQGFTLPEPIYRLRFDARVTEALAGSAVKAGAVKAKTAAAPGRKLETKIDAETLDVSPDTHLVDKINEERALEGDNDLLDEDRPSE